MLSLTANKTLFLFVSNFPLKKREEHSYTSWPWSWVWLFTEAHSVFLLILTCKAGYINADVSSKSSLMSLTIWICEKMRIALQRFKTYADQARTVCKIQFHIFYLVCIQRLYLRCLAEGCSRNVQSVIAITKERSLEFL